MLSINQILFCLSVGFGVQAVNKGEPVTKEQQPDFKSLSYVCVFDKDNVRLGASSAVIIEENILISNQELFTRNDGKEVARAEVYVGSDASHLSPAFTRTEKRLPPPQPSTHPLEVLKWHNNPHYQYKNTNRYRYHNDITLIETKGMKFNTTVGKIDLVDKEHVVKTGDKVTLAGYGKRLVDGSLGYGHLTYKELEAVSGEDLSKNIYDFYQKEYGYSLDENMLFGVDLIGGYYPPTFIGDQGGNELFYHY